MYRELLLGCGFRRHRLIDPYRWQPNFAITPDATAKIEERWKNVVAVDRNPLCAPDYVMDLSGRDWIINQVIRPCDVDVVQLNSCVFRSKAFDEIHAYEVLEHLGQQGDENSFFAHFEEMWRILKPGGFVCASVPSRYSQWLWGDPGHRRAILPASLVFLNQAHYDHQVGAGPSSDYRSIYGGNFHIVFSGDNEETHTFVLQALPPAATP
jgi:SAM-dependent methyltransferase